MNRDKSYCKGRRGNIACLASIVCIAALGAGCDRSIPDSVASGPTGDERAAVSAEGLSGTQAPALAVSTTQSKTINMGTYYLQ